MKVFKKTISPVALALCALIPAASAYAESLNWTQRGELFMKGTVTDSQHQVWNVILVPGVDGINQGAKDGITAGGEAFKTMGHKGFWKGLGQDFKDGLQFSKDVVTLHWIKGIHDDAKQAEAENQTITNGEIGAGLEHFASWAWFGVKMISRTVWMPIGTAGGVAYSVAAPVVMLVEKPVLEGIVFDGAIRGAAVPAVLYVWNGVAWTATSVGNVPTQESYFVHLEYQDPDTGKTTQLVIDQQGFQTLVQASVLQAMTADQRAKLQTKIDAVNAQIQAVVQPLQKQAQGLEQQQQQASQNLQSNPAQKALQDMYEQAMNSSQVTMSPDAKDAFLDQAKLRDVVVAYLKSQGVDSPAPDMVDAIVKNIGQTLEQMHVEMAKQGSPATGPNLK